MMKFKPLCIYHKNCLDGLAAAWVVNQFTKGDCDFLAADYDDPVPDLTDREVFIVDFSYKPVQLLPKLDAAFSVTIIDHHKTSAALWTPEVIATAAPTFHFHHAMDKSGAVLTWEYFFKDHEVPKLLLYCQDYDLWHKKLPKTDAVVAGLYAMPVIREEDFESFTTIMQLFQDHEDYFEVAAERGETILQYQKTLVMGMRDRGMQLVEFAGWLNIPYLAIPREFHSLAGSMLCKNRPFSVTYEDYAATRSKPAERVYSLRSDKDDPAAVDVEQIAVQFDGGGHKHAAGFTMPLNLVGPAGENVIKRRVLDSPPRHWKTIRGWTDDINEIAKGGLLRVTSALTRAYLFDIRIPAFIDYVPQEGSGSVTIAYVTLHGKEPRCYVGDKAYHLDFSHAFYDAPLRKISGTLRADVDTTCAVQAKSVKR